MAICPIICSFYYLARALLHDVAGEIACAEGCAETISANVLKRIKSSPNREGEAGRKKIVTLVLSVTGRRGQNNLKHAA